MLPIELVIFDNDGVLVDSEPVAARVVLNLLLQCGAQAEYEYVAPLFKGCHLPDFMAHMSAHYGVTLSDTFIEDFYRDSIAAFERELQPIAGIEALLRQLRVPFCVASNSGREKLHRSLEVTGLLPFFEGRVFCAADVGRGKPAPDLFLYAAAQCGARPENCLVVEDSVNGVKAAQAAGMHVVGYVPDGEEDRLSSFGIPIIKRVGDVLSLF